VNHLSVDYEHLKRDLVVKAQTKTPHRAWYFLLCYLSYSAYTLDFFLRGALEPQLMAIYHLNADELSSYYNLVYVGLVVGVLGFGCLVDMINYRTCFIWIWLAQILGLVKVFAISAKRRILQDVQRAIDWALQHYRQGEISTRQARLQSKLLMELRDVTALMYRVHRVYFG